MKMTEIVKGIAQMYRSNRQDINPDKFPNINCKQNMHPIWLHLNPIVIAGYCRLLSVMKHALHAIS